MSAETLRQAATLMRSRAIDAIGPDYEWAVAENAHGDATWWAFTDEDHLSANGILELRDLPQWGSRTTLWEHITGWSPAVALALADLLDDGASYLEYVEEHHAEDRRGDEGRLFLAVAVAYLGTQSPDTTRSAAAPG